MNLNEFSPVVIAILNAVLLALFPTLVVAALAALVGFTRKEWAAFKAAQPTLAAQLETYTKIAVEAAEQAGAAELITSKKDYAIEIVVRWLSSVGLNGIDVELIEAEIERQVRKMNKSADLLKLQTDN